MTSESDSDDEQLDAMSASRLAAAAFWPPVWAAIGGGYRLMGEHLVAAVAAAVALGACVTALLSMPLGVFGWLVVLVMYPALPYVRVLICLALIAVVCGVLAGRWLRQFLAGDRRRLGWLTPRGLQMALVLVVFLLVTFMAQILVFGWSRGYATLGIFGFDEGLPSVTSLIQPAVWHLMRAAVMAVMLPILPAIAAGADGPLWPALRLTRRAFPRLVAVFFIGLLPWAALDSGLIDSLVFAAMDSPMFGPDFRAIAERIRLVREMLDVWILLCGIALAGAAYLELARDEADRRIRGASA